MLQKRLPPHPSTPTGKWWIKAKEDAPILGKCTWVSAAAFRITDGIGFGSYNVKKHKAYIESIFKGGFRPTLEKVTVRSGMSTGGVASARKWKGASKYLCAEGQFAFLVAVEGYFLPLVDRQNRSEEIKSYNIPGNQILAGARFDKVDHQCGYLLEQSSNSISFNHRFKCPPWLNRSELEKRLEQYIQKMGGHKRHHQKEYKDLYKSIFK